MILWRRDSLSEEFNQMEQVPLIGRLLVWGTLFDYLVSFRFSCKSKRLPNKTSFEFCTECFVRWSKKFRPMDSWTFLRKFFQWLGEPKHFLITKPQFHNFFLKSETVHCDWSKIALSLLKNEVSTEPHRFQCYNAIKSSHEFHWLSAVKICLNAKSLYLKRVLILQKKYQWNFLTERM